MRLLTVKVIDNQKGRIQGFREFETLEKSQRFIVIRKNWRAIKSELSYLNGLLRVAKKFFVYLQKVWLKNTNRHKKSGLLEQVKLVKFSILKLSQIRDGHEMNGMKITATIRFMSVLRFVAHFTLSLCWFKNLYYLSTVFP